MQEFGAGAGREPVSRVWAEIDSTRLEGRSGTRTVSRHGSAIVDVDPIAVRAGTVRAQFASPALAVLPMLFGSPEAQFVKFRG